MKSLVKFLLFLVSISHVAWANLSQLDFTFSYPVNMYFYQGKIQGKVFETQSRQLNTTENQLSFFLNQTFSEDQLIDFANEKILKTPIDGLGLILFLDDKNLLRLTEEQRKQIPVMNHHVSVGVKLISYHDKVSIGALTSPEIPLGYLMDGEQRIDLIVQPIHALVKSKSCEINPNSLQQTVNLRKIAQSEIPTKGSEAFGGHFHLGLTCDEHVTVHAVVKDNTNPTNDTDILSLDTSLSTAKGVGIRLYKAEQRIQLQNPFEFSRDERHPNVLFSAKYVNTEGEVKAGTVNATAVISFSYK
ncbi:fimbrial protein [Pasteurella sp. PK-2025]|uniref:fimbrial protein n=1 Tax=unclassified Pasteurella TaxID=2621516 RepID=UPI003C78EDBA